MREASKGKCLFLDSIHVRLKVGISCHIIIVIGTICLPHCSGKCFILWGIFNFSSLEIDFREKVLYWGSENNEFTIVKLKVILNVVSVNLTDAQLLSVSWYVRVKWAHYKRLKILKIYQHYWSPETEHIMSLLCICHIAYFVWFWGKMDDGNCLEKCTS